MKVLVVEDDAALAAGLRDGLVAGGLAVDVAARLNLARRLNLVNRYDVIVLDLGMPDGDGLDFLRALRSDGQSVPILLLTARGTVAERVDGLNAGADDYLAKPFALPELVARVRALLRRPTSVRPAPLAFANLELDGAAFAVRCDGEDLKLTAKETAILEYLMLQHGTLVTRTMLLEHCWDDTYHGLSNLVDVHVSRLRRKLEEAGARCRLRTVRGAGFVFDAVER